jgi:uncharacterized protein YgiM (DUF1202 family)
MGILDIFKKSSGGSSKSGNPLMDSLLSAGFEMKNIDLLNEEGVVRLSGMVDDGTGLDNLVNFLRRTPGVHKVINDIKIEDQTKKEIKYRVETKVKFLNVRKGPSTDFQIKGKFANGDEVILVKKANVSWYKVQNKDLQGYCNTDYLKPV